MAGQADSGVLGDCLMAVAKRQPDGIRPRLDPAGRILQRAAETAEITETRASS